MSEDVSENQENNDSAGDEWGAAMEEQSASTGADAADTTVTGSEKTEEDYERAAFKDLSSSGQSAGQLTTTENTNLDVILDIPVTLSMEIGRTELPINNLLQLNQGSVVELDRLAGEPLDVLVNGTLIAHGEVVVVNEKFGIRLTDVISPAERVKKLK
jgi:flagellar motor switch protein FliN/FliY